MRINTNISAMNAHRQLSINNTRTASSLEKLSSGLRINRAGDDAAGLAISEQMRGQIRGLNQAIRNAQDGISLIQTAEGALTETHSILQRMRELSVQGSSDTLQPADRTAIQTELNQLTSELNRIADTTQFNGQVLLNGTFGVRVTGGTLAVGTDGVTGISVSGARASTTFTLTQTGAGQLDLSDGAGNVQRISSLPTTGFTGTLNFDRLGVAINVQNIALPATPLWSGSGKTIITGATAPQNLQIGANAGQSLGITIGNMQAAALGVSALSVATHTDANVAITNVSSAITTVSTQRSTLGAWQNRLQHTINNLGTAAENLTASESRIRDVDMANEMMEFTKQNILTQAATAMLAQANMAPQTVLQLLG
jgi:flagellin